ncbi:mitochondria fission 1, partial [Trichoderma arundinaceum]
LIDDKVAKEGLLGVAIISGIGIAAVAVSTLLQPSVCSGQIQIRSRCSIQTGNKGYPKACREKKTETQGIFGHILPDIDFKESALPVALQSTLLLPSPERPEIGPVSHGHEQAKTSEKSSPGPI